MTSLHTSLRRKLSSLQSASVEFNEEDKCFTVHGIKKRGVTKIIESLLPVPRTRKHKADDDSEDVPVPVVMEMFNGNIVRRCSTCKIALTWSRRLDPTTSRLATVLKEQKNDAIAHGTVVDYQLKLYVRLGRKEFFRQCQFVDPCVGTLIEQFDARGWTIVAAQLPIFDPLTDIATAIDLVLTDRETRMQVILAEIKASMSAAQALLDDAEYTRVRGIMKRSILKNLPQSYYGRHQMQLMFMDDTVQRNFAFQFDRSLVMRVAPGSVASYDLSPQFLERRTDIATALKTRCDRKKRAKSDGGATKKKRRVDE